MNKLTLELQGDEEMADRFADLEVGDEALGSVDLKVSSKTDDQIQFTVEDLTLDSVAPKKKEEPEKKEAKANPVTTLFR